MLTGTRQKAHLRSADQSSSGPQEFYEDFVRLLLAYCPGPLCCTLGRGPTRQGLLSSTECACPRGTSSNLGLSVESVGHAFAGLPYSGPGRPRKSQRAPRFLSTSKFRISESLAHKNSVRSALISLTRSCRAFASRPAAPQVLPPLSPRVRRANGGRHSAAVRSRGRSTRSSGCQVPSVPARSCPLVGTRFGSGGKSRGSVTSRHTLRDSVKRGGRGRSSDLAPLSPPPPIWGGIGGELGVCKKPLALLEIRASASRPHTRSSRPHTRSSRPRTLSGPFTVPP